MQDKVCGVYKIQNKVNGKLYIGSSINVRKRWYKHRALLRVGKHINPKLQASWNKHGEQNFEFSIAEECSQDVLLSVEQHWIDTLEVATKGYNINPIAGSNLGFKHSAEAKDKISKAMLGRKLGEATKAAIALANSGKTTDEETRKKISESVKKLAADPNYVGRKNFDRTGKKQTPEQIAKRVESCRKTKEAKKALIEN